MIPIAAVVITRNEENNIVRCLKSVQFCSEIIVVDSESVDRTRELALQFTPTVISRPWKGYAEQKNYAVGLAKAQWILSVDADEEVSEELKKEIQTVLLSSSLPSAYSVPRRTIHLGRWIRHGGWYPNRLVRVFYKADGQWVGSEVHEWWQTEGRVEMLASPLVHYSFKNLSDQVSRNNHYSSLGALSLKKQGKNFSVVKLFGKSFSKFMETYLLKKGFLDGYPGFIISVSAAYSVFLKWAKLWELERGEKKV